MMVSEGAIDPVILDVRLNDEDFYREGHRIVFRAIKRLYERGDPVDSISVAELLTQSGELTEAGGRERSPSSRTRSRRRATPATTRRSSSRTPSCGGCSTPPTDPASVHEREGEPASWSSRPRACCSRSPTRTAPPTSAASPRCSRTRSTGSRRWPRATRELTGTPSGFRDLDNLLGGFQPGNLIVVAARPVAWASRRWSATSPRTSRRSRSKPVAFFSLEMSEAELAHRFIACRSRIPSDRLRKGKVSERDWPRVVRACNELERRRCGSTTPPTSACSTCGPRRAGWPRARTGSGW